MKSNKKEKIVSIRDYPKAEREFFEDKNRQVKYIDFCMNCKQNKDISTIGREIGINSRTAKSMLYENQDMSFEVYNKLDKLLYPDSKRNKK